MITRKITILFFFILILGCTRQNDENYERFFYRTTDGADLAIQVDGQTGSGTFILLLHGGPGPGAGYSYNEGIYSELLEEKYAMVYLDQRGQGASQGSYSPESITLQRFADDIYEVVLLLKQKYGQGISIFLMGHSWGGTTGTYTLINTDIQNEIKGWIEANGAHDVPMIYTESVKMFIEIGEDEISKGNNIDKWNEIVSFAKDLDTNNISFDDGGKLNSYGFEAEGLIEEIQPPESSGYENGLGTSPVFGLSYFLLSNATANAIHDETEATSLTNQLGDVTLPTLLLWGKYDFVVPPYLGESALPRLGTTNKSLVIFDFSGHSPMNDQPEEFVLEIEKFIDTYK